MKADRTGIACILCKQSEIIKWRYTKSLKIESKKNILLVKFLAATADMVMYY